VSSYNQKLQIEVTKIENVEFVLEIPGQVNNEHERTPGEAAVMQINRASPRAETKTPPRPSQETHIQTG
jgi:hypothetical protein